MISNNDFLSCSPQRRKGFTLIELLIVVAIIAILAAIAVPNFLEAQTRSKVSRAKTDMRSVATALEAYAVDWTDYPYTIHIPSQDLDGHNSVRVDDMLTLPSSITSPISYISALPRDVWKLGREVNGPNSGSNGLPYETVNPRDVTFMYLNLRQDALWVQDGLPSFYSSQAARDERLNDWGWWQMRSVGPTGLYPGGADYPITGGNAYSSIDAIYDPTNGTLSKGQILRTQKSSEGEQKNP